MLNVTRASTRTRRRGAAALGLLVTTGLLALGATLPPASAAGNPTLADPAFQADPATLGEIPDSGDTGCVRFGEPGPPRDVKVQVSGTVGRITDIGVQLGISHTYASDVGVELIAPDGSTRAYLFSGLNGGGNDNDLAGSYLFSDNAPQTPSLPEAAADAFSNGNDPVPAGEYRASIPAGWFEGAGESYQMTPVFAGLAGANGTWTVRATDHCEDDTGTVDAVTLYVATTGTATAPATDTTAPDTDFLTTPTQGIATSLHVPFRFVADEAGVSYLCGLDGAALAACASPTTVTVKPGFHSFRVAARDAAGNVDPLPAQTTFTAYDCASLKGAVAKLGKQARATKKELRQTLVKLGKAQTAGNAALAKKLRAKATRLEKQHTRLAHQLMKAKAGAKPCSV